MNLCKYKNILGKPNEGIHSYRFCGLAIVDVILTIIAAFLISYFKNISFFISLLGLFLLGIFLHKLFCVRTSIDKILFPNNKVF
jgi:hypothetical protein